MARNSSRKIDLSDIRFSAQMWKEGVTFVAYSPELDVASCGGSLSKARKALREAVALFLEGYSRRVTSKRALLTLTANKLNKFKTFPE
jgi:predicted RNase H-like HicB family nuclease